MDYRSTLRQLAQYAASDPAHAAVYARVILDQIAAWKASGGPGDGPPGYLYAGARTIVIREEGLQVEPLPEEPEAIGGGPGGVPLTNTLNEFVLAKMPVDVLLYGVSGYGIPQAIVDEDGEEEASGVEGMLVSAAEDGRDLFSAQWNLDGEARFTSDGIRDFMVQGSSLVGTRRRPRPLAWRLERDQVLGVRFRNLFNAILPRESAIDLRFPLDCALVFYAIDLRRLKDV